MFKPWKWNETFLNASNFPGWNDAEEKYGVTVKRNPNAKWRIIGVHHLSGWENMGNHHIYCDVLDRDGKRINRGKLWLKQGNQNPVSAIVDKPPNEAGTNFPVWGATPVDVWVDGDSDSVSGMRINHADEDTGNTIGHHSFYVVFQDEAGIRIPDTTPGTKPVPAPTPAPNPAPLETDLVLKIKQEDVSSERPGSDGSVTLRYIKK